MSIIEFYVIIDFWDTAGQEAFAKMHPSYYYRAHCCILVFDVTRKATYQNLSSWYQELRGYCENIPCVLVANKIDVDYNVSLNFFNHDFVAQIFNSMHLHYIIDLPLGDKKRIQIRQ